MRRQAVVGILVVTQLTLGAVGGRHLLSGALVEAFFNGTVSACLLQETGELVQVHLSRGVWVGARHHVSFIRPAVG